jgi:hypothetical protein
MRKPAVFALLFLHTIVSAQAPQNLSVIAASAHVRAAPTTDATLVASVFANDNLIAVGRNIDGTWLEVRRPGRQGNIGWIDRDLVLATFDVGQIPITDSTTGLLGTEPVTDTGFSILTIDEIPLRSNPDRSAPIREHIPVYLTLPIIERTPNNQWLKVNYRGIVGWVPQFQISTRSDLAKVPLSAAYASDTRYTAIATITPEQQLAQIERLFGYIQPINQTAADVSFYWQSMSLGETLECRPPAGNYAYFSITAQDVLELPELRQQERLLYLAIDDLNAAIEAMQPCGVYVERQVREAYANALSAQGIFAGIIRRMENIQLRILDDHRQVAP